MTHHKDYKGIIHTTSYDQLDFIRENVSEGNRRRLLMTDPELERDEVIAKHAESKKPTVLISPSLHIGLDLKDDLSRFQIINKVPYLSLGDRWIDEKRKRNEQWYSWQGREELSQAIEANYEKIRLIILEQENFKNKSKPTLLQLGNIGSRFFGFNIYYNDDIDDVPISIRELIPTISPVRLDLMATTKTTKLADPNSTYLKAAQVYDDGSIKAKYYTEAIKEDEGITPP